MICKKTNIPIYTCSKTAKYLKEILNKNGTSYEIFDIKYNIPFNIDDIEVMPFEISHDAVEPCGFNISHENKTVTFATDLGYVSSSNFEYMKNSNFVVLESNYDLSMLDYGHYPFNLKCRIKGNLGHLSNFDTANTISSLQNCIGTSPKDFLLAHLSENNNMLELAKQTIDTTLSQNNIDLSSLNINYATKLLSKEEYLI